MVGYCYTYGGGVKRDNKKGNLWLKKAADQGHKDAAILLD
jgi:TPR repeat protein